MKKLILLLSVIGLVLNAGRAMAESETWLTDFAKAKKSAEEKQLPIMAVFSGSDWCSWCVEFDKAVLSKEEFKNFAKDSLVLFLADFPNKKKLPEETKRQNEQLAEKYGVESFPTVLLINKDGKVLAKTGYLPGGAKKYVEHLKSLIKG